MKEFIIFRIYESEGKVWRERASIVPATRHDIAETQERFELELRNRKAKPFGICPIRRDIYDQLFGKTVMFSYSDRFFWPFWESNFRMWWGCWRENKWENMLGDKYTLYRWVDSTSERELCRKRSDVAACSRWVASHVVFIRTCARECHCVWNPQVTCHRTPTDDSGCWKGSAAGT